MVSLIVVTILVMPIWYIKHIEVVNNVYYTKEEIIKAAQIDHANLLDLSFKRAKENLLELSYIKNVHITYHFPGKIKLDVVESAPFIYVPFMGSYLCLNEQGQVIEQTSEKQNEVPLVKGLSFSSFKTGEILPVINEDIWFLVKEIMAVLKENDYISTIDVIDVNHVEEIHLYVDNLDAIMGDIGDFDKKVRWLIVAHETYDMGILDLTNVVKTGQAPLRPIT